MSLINDEVLNDIMIEYEAIFTSEHNTPWVYVWTFMNVISCLPILSDCVSGIYSHDMSEHETLFLLFHNDHLS